jgi:hypothetical protein
MVMFGCRAGVGLELVVLFFGRRHVVKMEDVGGEVVKYDF